MSVFIGKTPEAWPKRLGCDLETSGLDPLKHRILSFALSDGQDTWVFYKNVHDLSVLNEVLEDSTVQKQFHNSKFDLAFLLADDELTDYSVRIFDNMIAESIIDAGRKSPLALQDILARRLGVMLEKDTRLEFVDHPGFEVIPPTEEQLKYIVLDVLHLPEITKKQINDLILHSLVDTTKLEFDIIPATVELKAGGITLDIDLWYQQAQEFTDRMDECLVKIKEIVGHGFIMPLPAMSKKKPCVRLLAVEPTEEQLATEYEQFNFKATAQVKQLFREGYGVPVIGTKKAILEDIVKGRIASKFVDNGRQNGPFILNGQHVHMQAIAKQLLEYRKWKKRLEFDYPKKLHPVTGKIHPNYHQVSSFMDDKQDGTDTGRFSSSKPNMQQVPRPEKDGPNMRHLFRGDSDDFYIIRADWAQQEPRIMGQMSGDPKLIQACNSQDVYLEAARLLFGRDDIAKADEERFIAKTFFLADMYGAGEQTLAESSRKSIAECRVLKQKLYAAFPGLQQFERKMIRQMHTYGFVTTAIGRKRYIDSSLYNAEKQAVNSPIQGSAADMFKLALGKVYNYLTEQRKCGKIHSKTRLWNIVHDEIELHVHKDDLDLLLVKVKELMEQAGREICPDVTHIAEVEYGLTWDK